MPRPKFFVGRSDRLIARIKDLLWAWRFSDQVGGQLFYFWPKLPARYDYEQDGYSPAMIFDLPEFYRAGGADRLTFVECDRIKFPDNGIALDSDRFAEQRKQGFDRAALASSDQLYVQRGSARARFAGFWFSDESGAGRHRLKDTQRLFTELPTDRRILQLIEGFRDKNGLGEEYSAVHVRRGDCYSMMRNALTEGCDDSRLHLLVRHVVTRTAPTEFYREEIENMIAKGHKIVLTSDSPESIRDFQKAYGAEHFVNLSIMRAGFAIQKAYADFLVLYGASRIVGTGSNFSRFAAQLKDTPFINVSGEGDFETAKAAFDREIVDGLAVDKDMLRKAHDQLETLYARHQTRTRGPLTIRPPRYES